ncbi:hypothetical protein MUS_3314 [Bacillus velezensis YAU B9601-Y2]|uniref:Uncharacterized protein n=1 Tax=Bacillus amyloliquefaciens (strain Y2) TaxID=1155777 RepID=I2C974_BACAY|nr:hypothetical protein MUS_3314 [Bacillus velezensis YAU B9601-Y2]
MKIFLHKAPPREKMTYVYSFKNRFLLFIQKSLRLCGGSSTCFTRRIE